MAVDELDREAVELDDSLDIAIVGMAGRFPGASDVDAFWSNLRGGVCAVTRFDEAELLARGVASELAAHPDYVGAAYLLAGSDTFDAEFFGYSPREAELMDPQHRVMLECAWAAMEDAGIDPDRHDGSIGVYAGAGHNTYLLRHVTAHPDVVDAMGGKQVLIGNRPDFLTTRVSYKLGLEGPSMTVQSACSTSLVAVSQACQALLAYQCDAALAGGVAVDPTRHDGYLFTEDGILSPDGFCRTFDERARGTVGGDGVGVVVLKRLQDAVADRDDIRAVIKGSAVNNDGARRAGFSAPSGASQAAVISRALVNANLEPETIRYVELHGTATNLGDPIEMSALKSAYPGTDARRRTLGAVKTNIGHLDAAAGVAGLIKTVLILQHAQIPPTLHFERPNPRLGMEGSSFTVNAELVPWPEDDEGPRRAAVSSFGLGGTNAHVVLEQAPDLDRAAAPGSEQLLVLSARDEATLQATTNRLQDHLRAHPGQRLDDVALTLQQGRRAFSHRRAFVARDVDEALRVLDAPDDGRLLTGVAPPGVERPVAFLFGGIGAQFPGMSRQLYETEAVFRQALDRSAEIARPLLGEDVREVLVEAEPPPAPDLRDVFSQPERSDLPIDRPRIGYPAVFAFEHALAELWASWDVRPDAMIGHSLGEYVAACVAGVFSLPDALRLVIERARLIECQGEGAMLAVPLGEEAAAAYTDDDVSIAVVNDPFTCVLSGTVEGIDRTIEALDGAGVVSRRLTTRFAFHSRMMDGVVGPYTALVAGVPLRRPTTPFVSNVTGTWITDEQATSPDYWGRHLRMPVRFADGVAALWAVPNVALVEIGTGQTLTSSALQHPAASASVDRLAVASLPGAFGGGTDRAAMLRAAARLWLGGRPDPFPPVGSARRTPLPTYPFDRRRYWLDARAESAPESGRVQRTVLDQWLYAPTWRRLADSTVDGCAELASARWLVFVDESGLGRRLADRLGSLGAVVDTVAVGEEWRRIAPDAYCLDPRRPDHYQRLADELRAEGPLPSRVVHCWSVGTDAEHAESPDDVAALLSRGFESLVHWAQATEPELMTLAHRWDVLTTEVCSVLGTEPICPPKATVQGLCKVLQQEYPAMTCVHVDLLLDGTADVLAAAGLVVADLAGPPAERSIAVRGEYRWAPSQDAVSPQPRPGTGLRSNGAYLVTGGLGRIGLLAAHALAERGAGAVALVGRTPLPDRSAWEQPQSGRVRSVIDAVRAVEASGARVLVLAADVSDLAAMEEAKATVVRELGPIRGVVHCAGTTGHLAHHAIADLGAEQVAAHFGPKVHGPYVLRRVLADQELDFAILCSSVAALLGGLGFGAYASANACLDAFAQRYHCTSQPWTSVDWEAWRFPSEDGAEPELGAAVEELALTPAEGRRLLDTLLGSVPQRQVIVSTGDMGVRRGLWAAPGIDRPPASKHERPNLRNPYVAAGTDAERLIAATWQEILGVDKVGVHDNFFELGGSSLLGLQVVHRLRNDLGMAVPLTAVYEGPTVRTLAGLVEQLRGVG